MAQGAAAARRLMIMVVVAALGAASLAACGNNEAPPARTSSSASPAPSSAAPTPTPTPEPTAPAKPATWSDIGAAGAVDAAVYFKDLYNYALATGDVSEWRALAVPGCAFCAGVADDIEKVYSAGGHFEGGSITVSATTLVNADHGIYEVQHEYQSDAGTIVAADGATEEQVPAASGFIVFELLRDVLSAEGNWRLSGAEGRDEPLPPATGDGK